MLCSLIHYLHDCTATQKHRISAIPRQPIAVYFPLFLLCLLSSQTIIQLIYFPSFGVTTWPVVIRVCPHPPRLPLPSQFCEICSLAGRYLREGNAFIFQDELIHSMLCFLCCFPGSRPPCFCHRGRWVTASEPSPNRALQTAARFFHFRYDHC